MSDKPIDILEELARKDPKAAERLRKAAKANGHAADRPPSDITPIRFVDLKGKTPPARRFIVAELLPAGCVTSLYGPGGVGKSLLAQMLGTAAAVGSELFGFAVEKGPVLGLMCEDDDDELWRRQVRINRYLGCDMDELGDLHLQGRVGLENTLAVYSPTGTPTVEAFFEMIRAKARELRPVLIILDPIALLFGGNENDRSQVARFVSLVGGLAREFGCAVLLLGHPAKPSDSEFSGSTAWSNHVRSRLLLRRVKDEEDALLLSWPKVNYAKEGELALRWGDRGVLVPAARSLMTAADVLEAEERAGRVRATFLAAVDRLAAQGRNVSHSDRAANYAPKVILEAGMGDGSKLAELKDALNGLMNGGQLVANAVVRIGSNRHEIRGLARPSVPAPEGVRSGSALGLRSGAQTLPNLSAPERPWRERGPSRTEAQGRHIRGCHS